MKKIVVLLFLFPLLISACASGAEIPTARQPASEATILFPTAPPTLTKTPPLAATSTLIIPPPAPLSAPTLLPLPQAAPPNVIQFAADSASKDIPDRLAFGESKTYMLNAMQGQMMSVSVYAAGGARGYFPLEIRGRDGTVLCPVDSNSECAFWRGTLPLTQEYYITVKSAGEQTDFTLRVSINPPGRNEQVFSYYKNGFALSYSDQFAPAQPPSSLNHKTDLRLALQWIDTNSYINTNLGEAYFVMGVSSDPQIVATCAELYQSGGGPEMPMGSAAFNGYSFAYSASSGVGAGNIYDQHIYRMAEKGVCYEAIYFIHSTNIGNYSPGVAKEFDQPGLMNQFNAILSTFQTK